MTLARRGPDERVTQTEMVSRPELAVLAGPNVAAAANLVGVRAGTMGLIGLVNKLTGGKFDRIDYMVEKSVLFSI